MKLFGKDCKITLESRERFKSDMNMSMATALRKETTYKLTGKEVRNEGKTVENSNVFLGVNSNIVRLFTSLCTHTFFVLRIVRLFAIH